ncbi:MAG: CBS domain-containing protein [Alphaproteobacteria bacterium]|nr:CBS domain-containing protein [Alphaproteobacteria bacterium]
MSGFRLVTRFDDLLARPGEPLRVALARLNRVAYQVVLDDDGRVVGTLTDGDVRRGLLGGAGVGDPVSSCMRADPTVGRPGDDERNRRLALQFGFVPLVDADRRLAAILEGRDGERGIAFALVMAGGLGTRLGELTQKTPKPLLPIGDKPILEHLMAGLESIGVSRVFLSTHYLAEQFEEFVARRRNSAEIEIVRERSQLGTAGALALVRGRFDGPLLILNADVLTDVNFLALKDFHERHNHDGTVVIAPHRTRIPFGIVQQDEHGLFQGIEEKPEFTHFIAAGIYYLAPEFAELVTEGERLDMPDLLNRGQKAGLKIGLFPLHEYWSDVGTPESFRDANARHGNDGK